MGVKIDSWFAVLGLVAVGGILVWFLDWHIVWIAPLLFVGGITGILAFQAVLFFRMGPSARHHRMRVLETNFGIDSGWYVELNGRRVALLTDPQYFDMFWASYRIEPVTEDADERQRMLSGASWWLEDRLVFRSKVLGDIAENAFPGGDFTDPGRVHMRALYLPIKEPNLWEALLLFARRKLRRC